jgi:hypothetical protein
MTDPQPNFSLGDVNAHLEALFLIIDADEGAVSPALEDRLDWTCERDDVKAIIRYLAAYAAALCRRAYQRTADDPGPTVNDVLHAVSKVVSHSVPRPE